MSGWTVFTLIGAFVLATDGFVMSPCGWFPRISKFALQRGRTDLQCVPGADVETHNGEVGIPEGDDGETEDDPFQIDFDELSAESARNAFASFNTSRDLSSMYVKPEERLAPRQAQWFPLLLAPTGLDGTYAGDVGFDPLGFCSIGIDKDKKESATPGEASYTTRVSKRVKWMREAEMKHSRLAMLAAVGWPVSELWHKPIAAALGLQSILAAGDRSPSVLNGGLGSYWILGTAVFTVGVTALLELRGMSMAEKSGHLAGDLGFDPLRLHALRSAFRLDPASDAQRGVTREAQLQRARKDMQLAEVKHGRLAMLAVAGYVAQEALTGVSVVQQTPFFFGDPIM